MAALAALDADAAELLPYYRDFAEELSAVGVFAPEAAEAAAAAAVALHRDTEAQELSWRVGAPSASTREDFLRAAEDNNPDAAFSAGTAWDPIERRLCVHDVDVGALLADAIDRGREHMAFVLSWVLRRWLPGPGMAVPFAFVRQAASRGMPGLAIVMTVGSATSIAAWAAEGGPAA